MKREIFDMDIDGFPLHLPSSDGRSRRCPAIHQSPQNKFAYEGAMIAERIDRENDLPNFEEYIRKSREYIQTHLVGAELFDKENQELVTVLDISDYNHRGQVPMWIALLQYCSGRFYDESATALCPPRFEIRESGQGKSPLENACAETDHSFEKNAASKIYSVDRCEKCGLSAEAIRSLLNHDLFKCIGVSCEDCGTDIPPTAEKEDFSYDIDGRRICNDCWTDYNERFGVPRQSIGESYELFCAGCSEWSGSEVPEEENCPRCKSNEIMIRSL